MKASTLLVCYFFLGLFISSCEKENENPITTCTTVIFDVVNDLPNIGTATLKRQNDQLTMDMVANNLTPGYAYTAWWVIWNKSENCATAGDCAPNPDLGSDAVEVALMFADGMIIGSDGVGTFYSTLKEDDISGSIHDIIGKPSYGGMQNARDCDVHYVIRNHGPEVAGQTINQTTTFNVGCKTNFPGFSQEPGADGECGNQIAAKFLKNCN